MVYKARNNNDVSREDIIKTLASLVTQNGDYSHTVDLSNPDLTIVVEIIKVHTYTYNWHVLQVVEKPLIQYIYISYVTTHFLQISVVM